MSAPLYGETHSKGLRFQSGSKMVPRLRGLFHSKTSANSFPGTGSGTGKVCHCFWDWLFLSLSVLHGNLWNA